MTKPSALTITLTLSLTAALACAEDDALELDGHSFRDGRGGGDGTICPRYLCGGNAGVGGGFSFNNAGHSYLDGKRLDGVTGLGGQPMQLGISGNTLYATYQGSGVTISGATLAEHGVMLHFHYFTDNTNFRLAITAYGTVNGLLDSDHVYPTYEFDYIDAEGGVQSLCADNNWDEGNSDPTRMAIVAQHEAYDWDGDTLHSPEAPLLESHDWLTIGCSGGAYAKKVLMGYDLNHTAPLQTTRSENIAMLNMLTARYCGDTNFTITGTTVYWQNQQGWFEDPSSPGVIEALWSDELGRAVCLNTPRYASRQEVIAECGPLPTCEDFNPFAYTLISYHDDGE